MTSLPSHLSRTLDAATPDVPVIEISTSSLREEARAATAVVAGLQDRGVSIRDIVIVARSLDPYEDALARAAIRHDIPPAFWTQIDLVWTQPFQLLIALCDLLDASTPSRAALMRPLELGWAPAAATDNWPIDTTTIEATRRALPPQARSVPAWQSILETTDAIDPRITTFIDWLGTQPEPTPAVARETLGDTITAYRDAVLPQRKTADSPALLETEQAARAVVQLETFVEQVTEKYAQRLADEWTDKSWLSIAGLFESLARQRPGRREHAHALAVDIVEANDLWARELPFVIAVGLVEGRWPRHQPRALPAALQHAILDGSGPAYNLSPRSAWIGGRAHDQFLDTVGAATTGLIVTRHTHDTNGVKRHRSPLLDHLAVDPITPAERRHLLGEDRQLPTAINSLVSNPLEAHNE